MKPLKDLRKRRAKIAKKLKAENYTTAEIMLIMNCKSPKTVARLIKNADAVRVNPEDDCRWEVYELKCDLLKGSYIGISSNLNNRKKSHVTSITNQLNGVRLDRDYLNVHYEVAKAIRPLYSEYTAGAVSTHLNFIVLHDGLTKREALSWERTHVVINKRKKHCLNLM